MRWWSPLGSGDGLRLDTSHLKLGAFSSAKEHPVQPCNCFFLACRRLRGVIKYVPGSVSRQFIIAVDLRAVMPLSTHPSSQCTL